MSLEQWIKDFPVLTRTYAAGALLTTAACALDMLSPYHLYLSFPLVFEKHQYWRLVTNFFFFGASFSLDFLFRMFFLVRYCRSLEEGSFRGRTADFFYLILFGATLMTLISAFVSITFLGSSLTCMMVYIWARRNPFSHFALFGVFTFTAPYLPWVMLGLGYLFGSNPTGDIVGIAVGHLYYFLEDVYPLMLPTRRRLLKTPHVIEALFQADHPADEHIEILPEAAFQAQVDQHAGDAVVHANADADAPQVNQLAHQPAAAAAADDHLRHRTRTAEAQAQAQAQDVQ